MSSLTEHHPAEPLDSDEVPVDEAKGAETGSAPVPADEPVSTSADALAAPLGVDQPQPATKAGWNEWALTSFVAAFASPLTVLLSGVPGFVFLSVLFVLLGVVAGHLSLRAAAQEPQLRGRGLGIVGLALSYAQLLPLIGLLILAAAFVGLVALTI